MNLTGPREQRVHLLLVRARALEEDRLALIADFKQEVADLRGNLTYKELATALGVALEHASLLYRLEGGQASLAFLAELALGLDQLDHEELIAVLT